VVRGFLATRSRWRIAAREEAPDSLRALVDEGGALRIWPHRHDMDGFFAVRLVKPT